MFPRGCCQARVASARKSATAEQVERWLYTHWGNAIDTEFLFSLSFFAMARLAHRKRAENRDLA